MLPLVNSEILHNTSDNTSLEDTDNNKVFNNVDNVESEIDDIKKIDESNNKSNKNNDLDKSNDKDNKNEDHKNPRDNNEILVIKMTNFLH